MPEALSPFAVLVGDVRLLVPVDPASAFAGLRKLRQAKPHKRGPLLYLHTTSAESVRGLLGQPPPDGLEARHVPSIVATLFAKPPLSAERRGVHSRVGVFLDPASGEAFVARLTAVVAAPSAGGPAAFVSVALDAEPLDLSDAVGLELGCLFVEGALANGDIQRGSGSDVWAWRDVSDDERQRVHVLSRLAGRDAVFRDDLAVGRGGIATLPTDAKRVVVVRGADDASIQRWRASVVPVVDVVGDDGLETVRAELCASVFSRLTDAVVRALEQAQVTAAAPAPAVAAPSNHVKAAPWRWASHARERAGERGISIALVDEHVVEPARSTLPKQINRDPDGPAQGRTVIVGQCPSTIDMPDGGRLYRGVIPGPHGDQVVILAVGWIPKPDGSRNIHTLYYPAAHPESWNADYTRSTLAGEVGRDFPRGTKWFLRQ